MPLSPLSNPVAEPPVASRAAVARTFSVAIAGSGGAGVMTAGTLLLDAAARAGLYGLMVRTSGPQIRGGEAAALLRLGPQPVATLDDRFDLLLAIDWQNLHRFADEIPLGATSLLVGDSDAGEAPEALRRSGAKLHALALKKTAKACGGAWVNMIALGLAGALAGLPAAALEAALRASWKRSAESLAPNLAALQQGVAMALGLPGERPAPLLPRTDAPAGRWLLSGNEAAGCGALRGGVRFVAAYPITPATELLEWMAPALTQVGGTLLQAEDELASVNMIIGASYGGVPSLTATAGPGLALMTEGIGLAVAAEVPIVVVDVMRGGPSTGIPAKSEQSDLSFAVDGLHGDAPRLVLAPNSIADCLAATEWAVQLAEALQAPAIVLSDQFMGQSRAVIDRPAQPGVPARRLTAPAATDGPAYQRYLDTPSGISPMAVPGTPGTVYTADGLEHSERGIPSSQAADHRKQLDKRQRKLDRHDYGARWADVEGDADLAVITFGSTTAAVREAVARAALQGVPLRLLSLRLLAPLRIEALTDALRGVRQVLVVEQNHGGQLLRYLRSRADLPGRASGLHRPGPLPLRPGELCAAFVDWAAAHAPQEATA
ncbi:MAG: 2-oxoacid:acceptor oxidoreductase subunit alpha [Rubrivivax sp.]|mgnify:FL=1|nr:2-oxoacid:acceptor oxidoreductase subunit alpha [Rubrivivax sp.]MBP6464506.1 2-oxoacid:acceptor oxidoreductase subunit alpha [Rubrivivax sp.]MBP9909017.1 2-oxoacid:acceptor oxidoreductase subunit alpha [Rubrivivax sp.]HRC36484.1 2-oxoacid:acceptor oxidoreductase subunit alpha [Rubrivivax sp.]